MNSNFFDSVIRATHRVITTVRLHAFKNTDPQMLARMLDYADPLGFVLMDNSPAVSETERIVLFRRRLQDIEDTFQGFNGLVESFDDNMKSSESIPDRSRELAAAKT
jgi:hypothetical protein